MREREKREREEREKGENGSLRWEIGREREWSSDWGKGVWVIKRVGNEK